MGMPLAQVIAVLRIGLGVEFVVWASAKLESSWLLSGAALADFLIQESGQAPAPYATMIRQVIRESAQGGFVNRARPTHVRSR
jgi:hypothetical protein